MRSDTAEQLDQLEKHAAAPYSKLTWLVSYFIRRVSPILLFKMGRCTMMNEKREAPSSTGRRFVSHKPVQCRVPLRAADARRSVKNILLWNSYLPSDCVRTMVRMGWDYTT
jgi:hypothetical protein